MNQAFLPSLFPQQRKLPMVLQEELSECGHACIAMISQYFGHQIDLFSLRKMHQPSARGMTLLSIKALLETLDFSVRAIKAPLEALKQVKLPAILHWNTNHFVVLKKVNKQSIVIHDPAVGIRHCNWSEVNAAYTGIVLEVEKSLEFREIRDAQQLSLSTLFKTVMGIKPFIGLLLILSLAIEVFGLINPLFLQFVMDSVMISGELQNLVVIATAFLLFVCLRAFSEYIRGSLVTYLTTHMTKQFSENVMRHLLRLPLHFFEQRSKGDIQSKFQAIDQIQAKISTDFVKTALDGMMVLINVIVMLIYSRVLTSIVIAVLGIYWGLRYASYHALRLQTETSIKQHTKAASIFLETLQVIMPIKSFLKEGLRFNLWQNAYVDALTADVQISKIHVFYHTLSQWLFEIEQIIVVCCGAYLVLANQFSAGMLVAFLSYRMMMVNKASSLIQTGFEYRLISIQLNRLSDILFQHPEPMAPAVHRAQTVHGALKVSELSFKYNQNEKNIFENINLEINPGEKVAIVGPSGCGKTTLLKLMMGLLSPGTGEIYVDGALIQDFGLKNYRELTACVMQDDALMSGTILENISFLAQEVDLSEVYRVAQLACIHDDICRFPMGYETQVGELGSFLSGGQKQRLLLARALYKKPKLLFLDEASSHLDTDNEKSINAALKSLDITQIIIAHRQETIKMADRVIDLGLDG